MAQTITGPGLPAAIWTLVSVAIALTVGRYLIRALVFKKVSPDDYTHGIALLALLGFSVCTQSYVNHVKHELAIKAGVEPMPADYANYVKRAHQFQTGLSVFAWISLWSVKFTFLLFYRMLFEVSDGFVKAWWVVAVFTFGTFWIPIAGVLTACGKPANLYKPEVCEGNLLYQQQLLEYSSAFQVATDLIIMILPLWMVRRMNLPPIQKCGLALIFSIALVTVALEILRTSESVQILRESKSVTSTEYSASLLFAILEINFSVIISCLPVYRALVGHNRQKRRKESWATMLVQSDSNVGVGRKGFVGGGGGSSGGGGGGLEAGFFGEGASKHSNSVSSPRRDSFAKWTTPETEREGGFDFVVPRDRQADARSEEMVQLGSLTPVQPGRSKGYY